MPDARGQRRDVQATSDSSPTSPPSGTALPGGKTSLPGGSGLPKPTAELPAELAALGKFEPVRKLGEGGMGAVFLARHTFLDRLVAIKVMSGAAVGHAEARERFLAEMRAGGRLGHPNVAQTIDAAQAGDALFLVMEYIDGASLDKVVKKKGPLPPALACRCAQQAAMGLQHAFEKGMAHRDVKPANLMVTRDGTVKVLDFGLARLPVARGEARKTEFQTFLGTADYVSPEQAKDARSADIRSDIYSLGCTLYFLLCGRPPFDGASFVEVAMKHVTDEPTPLPGVPAELWAVIAKMMAKQPSQRYQAPAEVVAALQPFAQKPGRVEESNQYGVTPPPLPEPQRRRPVWLVAGAAVAVPVTAGLVWLLVGLFPADKKDAVSAAAAPVSVQTATVAEQDRTKEEAGAQKEGQGAAGVQQAAGEADPKPPPAKATQAPEEPPAPVVHDPDRGANKPEERPQPPRPDPEKVAERLEQARAEHKAARDSARADLIAAITAEAKACLQAKRYKDEELTQQDLKKFEINGTPPGMPGLRDAASKYVTAVRRAHADMDAAYTTAMQDFRAAAAFGRERSAEQDRGEHRREKLPTLPTPAGSRTKRGKR